MNESSNKRAVIVGIFIITGLVLLTLGILLIGNLHDTFKQKFQIVTIFDNVNGLQKGNNIWFSGVKVGTVSSVHFFGKSQVAVNMKIETKSQQYIRKDAKVKISTDGLIGNKILVIYEGTEMAREVQEGDTLVVDKSFTSEDMMNTLQENNKNILAITTDFKTISKKLVDGEGTIGKLLNDNTLYTNINATTLSLQNASLKAQKLVSTLTEFSAKLNKEGTLANDLVSDTIVFNAVKLSVLQLQGIADTASVFIDNLKKAGNNPNTSVGVLLHDEAAGTYLKQTIKNLESSSAKLDEDLEALQHNFLLRRYFKKKAKAEKAIEK